MSETIGSKYGKPSTEVKEKQKDVNPKENAMDSFLGINAEEKRKIEQIDDQLKIEKTEHYRMTMRVWFRTYKAMLRGRIIELVDKQKWKEFGVKLLDNGQADKGFDYDIYAKSPEKYEKAYQEQVAKYIDPKYGGNKLMFELKMQYERNLTKHRGKFANLMANARKENILLTMDDLVG